jgi:hypothetical protein
MANSGAFCNPEKLFGGLMFSRDTVGDAQNSAQMSPCSGATRRMQKLF